VLLWIHGGSFSIGGASQTGYIDVSNNFVTKSIIVVSVQFRLGPLGMLCHKFFTETLI
jgi:para-nitrobenzyl esterase